MIYINNCKLLIIISAKILKNINYPIIHPSHNSHPHPCGSHPTAPPSLPVLLAPLPPLPPSPSEFLPKNPPPMRHTLRSPFPASPPSGLSAIAK